MNEKLEQIASDVISVAFDIHRALGPGLLERVYQMIMYHKLTELGYSVEREKKVSFEYEGILFEDCFRADLVIDGCFIVELKSQEYVSSVHYKQLLTYLRLTDTRLGLLINFGVALLKDGIKRVAN